MWYNAAVHEWTIKEMIKAEHRVTLTLFNVFSFKASLIFRKSSGSPCGTQGPLYVSSHPSISIFPLSSLFSPLPGSPQLRRPGAFRHTHMHSDTHTHSYTHQRTQQEMPNTSFRMMPLCQFDKEAAGSVTREGNRGREGKSDRWRALPHRKRLKNWLNKIFLSKMVSAEDRFIWKCNFGTHILTK